jgi:hypothetical protein
MFLYMALPSGCRRAAFAAGLGARLKAMALAGPMLVQRTHTEVYISHRERRRHKAVCRTQEHPVPQLLGAADIRGGCSCRLTFEFTRGRKLAKPAVARRAQRRVRRHAAHSQPPQFRVGGDGSIVDTG